MYLMKKIRLAGIYRRIGSVLLDLLMYSLITMALSFLITMPVVTTSEYMVNAEQERNDMLVDSQLYVKDPTGDSSTLYSLSDSDSGIKYYYEIEERLFIFSTEYLKSIDSETLVEEPHFYTTYFFNVFFLNLPDVLDYFEEEPSSEDTLYKYDGDYDNIGIIKDESKFPIVDGHNLDDEKNTLKNYWDEKVSFSNDILGAVPAFDILTRNIVMSMIIAIGCTAIAVSLVYYLIIPLFMKNCQTIGKRILSLIVLTDDGYVYSKWKYVLRYLSFFGIEIIGGIASFGATIMISYTILLFTKKRRCLHDYICQSVVADDRYSTYFKNKEVEKQYILDVQDRGENYVQET